MLSKNMLNRKGVSPVIATVLLVAMVIVLALIVFLWFRGITKEAVTKFGGTNIEIVCNDVSFVSDYSSGILSISNEGNVPIYSIELKEVAGGSHKTESIKDLSGRWPEAGLNQGGIYSSEDLSSDFSEAERIIIIPVLVGTSKNGERTHVCGEAQGQELIL
jgi:flagellin-like protein